MKPNDSIADLLTNIRNAVKNKFFSVKIFNVSKKKISIIKILKSEGFIKNFFITEKKNEKFLTIILYNYSSNSILINGLKRISKPSRRIYVKSNKIPNVLNGKGVAIISTSKGVVTGKVAKNMNIGGELLAYIW